MLSMFGGAFLIKWQHCSVALESDSNVFIMSVITVALTNLEDVENATRAYEQAVNLDE